MRHMILMFTGGSDFGSSLQALPKGASDGVELRQPHETPQNERKSQLICKQGGVAVGNLNAMDAKNSMWHANIRFVGVWAKASPFVIFPENVASY